MSTVFGLLYLHYSNLILIKSLFSFLVLPQCFKNNFAFPFLPLGIDEKVVDL